MTTTPTRFEGTSTEGDFITPLYPERAATPASTWLRQNKKEIQRQGRPDTSPETIQYHIEFFETLVSTTEHLSVGIGQFNEREACGDTAPPTPEHIRALYSNHARVSASLMGQGAIPVYEQYGVDYGNLYAAGCVDTDKVALWAEMVTGDAYAASLTCEQNEAAMEALQRSKNHPALSQQAIAYLHAMRIHYANQLNAAMLDTRPQDPSAADQLARLDSEIRWLRQMVAEKAAQTGLEIDDLLLQVKQRHVHKIAVATAAELTSKINPDGPMWLNHVAALAYQSDSGNFVASVYDIPPCDYTNLSIECATTLRNSLQSLLEADAVAAISSNPQAEVYDMTTLTLVA